MNSHPQIAPDAGDPAHVSMGQKSKSRRSTSNINDIQLEKWKDYDDLLTDSLWIIENRDKSGAHSNAYHGNFVPQIPNQLLRRFSKPGDVILDLFLGSGTTLIECKRLGRHGIGVELNPNVAAIAAENILSETNPLIETSQCVIVGDSANSNTNIKVISELARLNLREVQMIFLHPPYDDIIKFSESESDLSNSGSTFKFIELFGEIIEKYYPFLSIDGHIVLVIGDKYSHGEWVPLGFHLMSETLKRCKGLILKSTIVKNMSGNRAKMGQQRLWRYRALSGGFFIFKHEYIFLFRKKK